MCIVGKYKKIFLQPGLTGRKVSFSPVSYKVQIKFIDPIMYIYCFNHAIYIFHLKHKLFV